MAFGIRAEFDPIREVAFGDIGAAYAVFGSAITDYTRAVRIVNGTNADVYVSTDGTSDHIRVNANTFVLWDIAANKQSNSQLQLPKMQFYQKRVAGAPSSGTLWMECLKGGGGT